MGFYKCKKTLKTGVRLLQKKGSRLTDNERLQFEKELKLLDQALLNKNKKEAIESEKIVSSFIKTHFPKTLHDHLIDLGGALVFALIVAFLIRQFWFELYEVPTGSMRPTVEELDRMVVSKSRFGLHIPFIDRLLLYKDKLLKRAGIIVFTVAGMDVADADMMYFKVIPGKKRYIKRCVAKPGDTIYFYGGRIYGIDKEGKQISELADEEFLKKYKIENIAHIPFITFEGRSSVGKMIGQRIYDSVTFKQMNLPVAKIKLQPSGTMTGEFFNGKEWVKDQPEELKNPHTSPVSYSDLWGIGNFAMARLLTKEEVENFYGQTEEDGLLYLELHHTPNITYPKPAMRQDDMGRYHPMITPFTALLPLSKDNLDSLQHSLTTARFYVRGGRAFRYSEEGRFSQYPQFDPKLPGIPDGCYEFYRGKGYCIHFGGVATELAKDHPLYSYNIERIKTLFNMGIGFNIVFEPIASEQPYVPQRFAYFRDGDLYVMDAPFLKKDDPRLQRFVENELKKQTKSSNQEPYIAFIDHGAPLKNGKIDKEFIQAFGLKIPNGAAVALGDNYAMSADSRDFGFVPTANLRGAPSFTFWPPGNRLGALAQPPYPWLTPANIIVWVIVFIVAVLCYWAIYTRQHRSYFDK